jgi:hypothetical protein
VRRVCVVALCLAVWGCADSVERAARRTCESTLPAPSDGSAHRLHADAGRAPRTSRSLLAALLRQSTGHELLPEGSGFDLPRPPRRRRVSREPSTPSGIAVGFSAS